MRPTGKIKKYPKIRIGGLMLAQKKKLLLCVFLMLFVFSSKAHALTGLFAEVGGGVNFFKNYMTRSGGDFSKTGWGLSVNAGWDIGMFGVEIGYGYSRFSQSSLAYGYHMYGGRLRFVTKYVIIRAGVASYKEQVDAGFFTLSAREHLGFNGGAVFKFDMGRYYLGVEGQFHYILERNSGYEKPMMYGGGLVVGVKI